MEGIPYPPPTEPGENHDLTMCPLDPPSLFYTPDVNRDVLSACSSGGVLFYANRLIVNASQHLTWNAIQAVPAREVGLVLGAKPGNRYFIRRINTAAALYHAGKVKWLLVSGDNGQKEYDEPSAMQQALITKGVPEAAIFVIMPDSPHWTPWFAPGRYLVKTALQLFRKRFIISGRSG